MKNKKEKSNGLEAYYTKIQLDFADKLELFDKIKLENIKTISGIDLAYWKEKGTDYAVCCIVTINYCSKEIVEIKSLTSKIEVPYIPGYLSFRELPLIINTFKMLESNTDLIMFDGNGYLHYRNMAIATHASFYLNKPTIGVAKSYLKINNADYLMPEDFDGAYTDIIIKDKVYGRVVIHIKVLNQFNIIRTSSFSLLGKFSMKISACRISSHSFLDWSAVFGGRYQLAY